MVSSLLRWTLLSALLYVPMPGRTDGNLVEPSDALVDLELPIVFTMPGPNEVALHQQGSYYRPVTPPPQAGPPCGHYGTPACKVEVAIPPGATGQQLYQMGRQAEMQHHTGEAIAYLEASANTGYDKAEGALGMAYLHGNGVKLDTQKGLRLLEQSAAQGNRGSAIELGMQYEDGVGGVPHDQAKALVYIKAAAEEHQSIAEHRLGLDYETGNGLPHDRALAITWLRRAAADGATVAGQTATYLASTRHGQFRSIDELDDAVFPPPPPPPPGACPTLRVNLVGPAGMAAQYVFCQCHPGCPTVGPVPQCGNAGATPHCTY
jgi:hypothetical protein